MRSSRQNRSTIHVDVVLENEARSALARGDHHAARHLLLQALSTLGPQAEVRRHELLRTRDQIRALAS